MANMGENEGRKKARQAAGKAKKRVLSRSQVTALVACPTCGAPVGQRCRGDFEPLHEARWKAVSAPYRRALRTNTVPPRRTVQAQTDEHKAAVARNIARMRDY
jgi:hypothetical protein